MKSTGSMGIVLLVIIALLVGYWPRSDANQAQRVLAAAGYAQVTITGGRIFGCGEGDWTKTGFAARGPSGVSVTGVVCGGSFWKGNTLRLD